MQSILGIVKDKADENEIIYSSQFKKIAFKDFVILNLVLILLKKKI
jgi:hypothetical protein